MTARVVSINVSRGGVPKLPIERALVTTNGIEGDKQRDRRFHGGPQRALCLYSLELIDQLALEGHPIIPGSIGDNVTISGLDWGAVKPGVRMTLGPVEVEITSFTVPCKTIRKSCIDEDFTRISQKLRPGWSRVYARVVRDGELQQGDPVSID
jgi:MOSC domain-containing protein YiiM